MVAHCILCALSVAVKMGRVPKIPANPGWALPKQAAVARIKDNDPYIAEAVYDHWVQRRKQGHPSGGPLLAHLWFEQPWKVGRGFELQPACK